jgi:hypothetical protein
VQAGFGADPGIADLDAFLVAVLVEQARRVQVHRVALGFAGQSVQRPREERPEAREILPRAGEALEETRERRLARHPLDPQQGRHHRIAPQVGHVGEFLRPTEQALDETEHLGQRAQCVVGGRLRMRQAPGDHFAPATLLQERPKRRSARVRAELLVGELDLDRLAGALELDLFGHLLVNRVFALRLIRFHSPSVSSRSVAPFQLHRYG